MLRALCWGAAVGCSGAVGVVGVDTLVLLARLLLPLPLSSLSVSLSAVPVPAISECVAFTAA